ncbi:DUF4118 domain-containing protein [Streptomyces sp. NRRL B-24484]|uniref:DUF4118 domain-containing protein n=1 Tax=Streptomyces sp. NRRL B-24484 TaxID=1463833 RepID=UPI003B63C80B
MAGLLRGSLGLSGALLCLLLVVAWVARLGGLAPAAGTTAAGALAADFFFTFFPAPWHSLAVGLAADVAALAVCLAVAGVVSHVIDGLARRSQEASRARAEAQALALARLAGESVRTTGRTLPRLPTELRRTFGQDAAGIMVPTVDGWRTVAASGSPLPVRPEDAPFAAECDQGAMLVLAGPSLGEDDLRLLGPFVTQLRLAEERERLAGQAAGAEAMARTDALHTTLLEAAAHDLREPLAAIRAAASRLGDGHAEAAEIEGETDRLGHIVANLLRNGGDRPRPPTCSRVVTALQLAAPAFEPAKSWSR